MSFITASSRFDRDTAEAIAYLRLFGKNPPAKAKRSWVIAFAVLGLLLAGLILVRGAKWHLVLFLILDIVVLYAVLQLPKVMPAVQYDKFGALKDTESRFLFGPEKFIMTSSVEEFRTQHPVAYADLEYIYESDSHLFFYHREKILYVADKSTVPEGQLPALLELLQTAVAKYVRCEC